MRTAFKITQAMGPAIMAGLLLPFFILLAWAFTGSWPADALFPARLGLRGWAYVFSPHSQVMESLALSVALGLAVTACALMISIPAGKALGLYDFPGKTLVEVLVMAPIIIPPITIGMGLSMYFIKIGLIDTLLGVLLVHLTFVLPYGIRVFASAYKAMGTKWDDQARVLGAGRWQRFIHVTLPFLGPAVVSGSILMFNVSFSQYFTTFLIGGGKIVTLPVLLFPFVGSGDRVVASAISVIFVAAAVMLMIAIERAVQDPEREREFYYL